MKIESIQNEKVKQWMKLKEKKYRDKTNLFLVEEEHLVKEGVEYGRIKEILTLDGKSFQNQKTIQVTKEIMKKLSNQVTIPKIIAICEKVYEQEIKGPALFLDGIQDPGNLGTIIRSSVAFDMPNIILNENTVDLYNPKVIRSTEGMIFKKNIVRKNTEECLKELKEQGYKILGTDVEQGVSLESISLPEKYVIIIGSEGIGMRKETRKYCDDFLKIPMNSACESLNAGVSASILLYEARKKVQHD